MIELSVRQATSDDLSDIFRIEQTFGAGAFSKRSLRRLLSKTIVVDYDGVIAYCTYFAFKKTVKIYNIAVDSRCRNQGLARKLLKEVEDISKQSDKENIMLEVAADNIPAKTLYESLGYETIKLLDDYYGDGKPALKMKKGLLITQM